MDSLARTLATLLLFAASACAPDRQPPPRPPAAPLPSAQPSAPIDDVAPPQGRPANDAASEAEVGDAAAGTDATAEAPTATTPSAPQATSACNAQVPQEFLIRGNWFFNPKLAKNDQKKRADLHGEAVRYRTEHYGYFRGFGRPEWNAHSPSFYAVDTKFFGVTVKMHKSVVPALSCVEEEIRSQCSATPYTPKALGGIRFKNTYHTGEITNHAYGIAIDIDPVLNPCCGCVPPWNNAPQCRRPSKTPYDRMSLPECWVHAFTKYGFYWLGYDPMKDTMHFEFLGDPAKVVRP